MIVLYLASLVVSVGVVAVQLLGGAHGHDVDVAGQGVDAHAEHDGASAASLFLSARFWTFALLASGFVGTMLTLLRLASPSAVVVLALTSGLVSGLFAALVFRALRRSDAGARLSLDDAIGSIGRVLVPCARGHVGKVRVVLRGATVDLLAMTETSEIEEGARVVVTAIEGGVAKVERAPHELEA